MEKTIIESEDFYRHLAHLFYAFAAADRKIVLEEKQSIINSVEQNWDFHFESFDAKEIIYSTLRKIIDGKLDADLAFVSFEQYYIEYKNHFSPDLKLKIAEATDNITRSFSGRNKSELIMLSRLHLLFKGYNNN
jgi:hypothetical protein